MAGNFGGFVYTVQTVLKEEIYQAVLGSSQMKKEVQKVFDTANSRIRSLKNQGLTAYSTAYQALGARTDKGGAFFSTAGYLVKTPDAQEWQRIKEDYAEAVAFLNNPDSTPTGAKMHQREVRDAVQMATGLDVGDEVWNALVNDNYFPLMSTFASSGRFERYVQTMNDILYDYIAVEQERMEADAKQIYNEITEAIDGEINRATAKLTEETADIVFNAIDKFTFKLN